MGLPIRRLILATNENDVLDEFFRTGRYRPRRPSETHATSSPSMDITKASNFERYIFDVVGRDPGVVRELWANIEREGGFELTGAAHRERVAASGFVSGVSTHSDRVATIKRLHSRHKTLVDPHTADGIKVGLERRDPAVPLICIETALPAKFGATIKEAIGREPERPVGLREPRATAAALRRHARRHQSRQSRTSRHVWVSPHDGRAPHGAKADGDRPLILVTTRRTSCAISSEACASPCSCACRPSGSASIWSSSCCC
jgi:threonine synthase